MTVEYPFVIADVFTQTPFGGNQLAVFPDARGLTERRMQDLAAWAARIADGWSPHLYVFAGGFRDHGSLQARSFVPAFGIGEDPATGSAAAGLVAYLAQRSTHTDTVHHLRIEQGVQMGRPSLIDTTAHTERGRLTHVTVGGFTTIVGRGTITLPNA